MILIPAIDLRDGRVVRLAQGDFARETRYRDDPVALARRYADAGAAALHVVDLDAARAGGAANLETIHRICRAVDIPVQTGGGVRCREGLDARLEAGAARVVVGSLCVRNPDRVADWLTAIGPEQIVAGLDVRREPGGAWTPMASGWTDSGKTGLFELLEQFRAAGLAHLLCTDIARDGMYSGASVGLYETILAAHPGLAVQASGGIGSEADLEAVAATGAHAVIVGRALLEGRVPMEAIQRWSR